MPKKNVPAKPKGKAAQRNDASTRSASPPNMIKAPKPPKPPVPPAPPVRPTPPKPPRPTGSTTKVVISTGSRSSRSSEPTWLFSLGWTVILGGLVLYNWTPIGLSIGADIVNDIGSLDIANPKAWQPATSGEDYLRFVIILVIHLALLRYALYRLILNPIAKARKPRRKPLPPKTSTPKIVQGSTTPTPKIVVPPQPKPLIPVHPRISVSVGKLQAQKAKVASLDRPAEQRDALLALLTEACDHTVEYFKGVVPDSDVELFQELLDTLNASLRYYVRSAGRYPSSKSEAGKPDPMNAIHARIIAAIEGYADYALKACQRREFPFEKDYENNTDSLAALKGIEVDLSTPDEGK